MAEIGVMEDDYAKEANERDLEQFDQKVLDMEERTREKE